MNFGLLINFNSHISNIQRNDHVINNLSCAFIYLFIENRFFSCTVYCGQFPHPLCFLALFYLISPDTYF